MTIKLNNNKNKLINKIKIKKVTRRKLIITKIGNQTF